MINFPNDLPKDPVATSSTKAASGTAEISTVNQDDQVDPVHIQNFIILHSGGVVVESKYKV